MAAAKGILTLVDGAQSLGVYDLDLKDLGCDFYTGSTHKWLMGPLENGILYVKKRSSGQLWPNLISAGVTVISIPDKKTADVSQKLYETYGIAMAPKGGIRMSPHIYNTLNDIDKVVKALGAVLV